MPKDSKPYVLRTSLLLFKGNKQQPKTGSLVRARKPSDCKNPIEPCFDKIMFDNVKF
jgi:hypothetical protein